MALEHENIHALVQALETLEPAFQGFAFEGAAMAMALLDRITPWKRNRLATFLEGPGDRHIYMMHIGAGWALARLRRRPEPSTKNMNPLLRWLVADGYGFHEGFFHSKLTIEERTRPRRIRGYAQRMFDQGLGRSLWFVRGADVSAIAETIARFDPARQADVWNGIGLACTYAGGVGGDQIESLRRAAANFLPEVAQGAAFAAKARLRAGNPVEHTHVACRILCDMASDEAAQLTDAALEDLPADGPEPAFKIWRRRIQKHFRGPEVMA